MKIAGVALILMSDIVLITVDILRADALAFAGNTAPIQAN
jgi:hypothetical protein